MNKEEKRIFYGIGIFLILWGAGFLGPIGLYSPFGINPYAASTGGTSTTTIPLDGSEVYTKITVRKLLATSTSDQIVNMYDANGNFLDTVTTSSGVGTFTGLYSPGESVWLQARQAAPATADPYVSALTEWIVPGIGADSADTVSLRNVATGESILWVRDVTSTAPTLVVRNGFNNDTVSTTTTVHSFNSTDDGFIASMVLTVSNTYYGSEDFTDMVTGKTYAGGVFIVLKSNNTHSFTDCDYVVSDNNYNWYIWKVTDAIFYDANGNAGSRSCQISVSVTSGGTLTTGSSMVFDVFDMIQLHSGVPLSDADFIDGGAVGVTAVTTVVQ